jgi:ribosomal protein S18 acetylase RimI-like enzyme
VIDQQERFRRWHLPWKERVAEQVAPFSHGKVFHSPSRPDYWELNCIRVERPMGAAEMLAAADAALEGCRHRLAEWIVPMPDATVQALRKRAWMATPLLYMLHDGSKPAAGPPGEVREVDYDDVRALRELWHREDFGQDLDGSAFHAQARAVAELADVRVLAAIHRGTPIGFAQVQTHDGGSEVTEVYVHPDHRSRGLGTALTATALALAAARSGEVWICAERDNRPRRLYERLGFRPVAETAVAIRLPPPGKA